MSKADMCYRISGHFWQKKEKFLPLLEYLAAQPDRVQDIALLVGTTHSVRKLELAAAEIPRIREALAEIRSFGFGAGINLLCTTGHHFENGAAIPPDIVPFTDMNGNVCPGTLCPRQPGNREYLRKLWTLYVETAPDYLWLDDDIRFCGHGDIKLVCFCDHCMTEFNRKHGTALTREALKNCFDSGSVEDRLKWRDRWLTFSTEGLCRLFTFAEEVVHSVDPSVRLGAMDGAHHAGDNATMAELATALRGGSDLPLRWRPGGGAYTDERPDDFLVKAHWLGSESANIPDFVNNIQAEVENFNYQRLCKSKLAVQCEATLYLAAGVTGCAWNCLEADDPLDVYKPLIDSLSGIQPFLDLQSQWSRIRPEGIWHSGRHGLTTVAGIHTGTPWEQSLGDWQNPHFSPLFAAGLPAAYRLQDAAVTILTPESAGALPCEELLEVFRRGVYCPASVIPILEERGMSDLVCFRITGKTRYDAVEELLPHPLNDGAAGWRRDCRQSFPWGHEFAYHLECTADAGESLARLVDYGGNEIAPCSLGIAVNKLGGRVAVSGYYPMRDVLFERKITTVKRLFRWLADDRIPAELLSYHRIAMWVRRDGNKTVVQLCNASLDPAENVRLRITGASANGALTGWDLNTTVLAGTADRDSGTVFEIPLIPPWQTVLFVCE